MNPVDRPGFPGYGKPPGVIGGKEGRRRLELALEACRAYREGSGWSPQFRMTSAAERETIEELFGL